MTWSTTTCTTRASTRSSPRRRSRQGRRVGARSCSPLRRGDWRPTATWSSTRTGGASRRRCSRAGWTGCSDRGWPIGSAPRAWSACWQGRRAVVLTTSNTPRDEELELFGDPLENLWKTCVFRLLRRGEVLPAQLRVDHPQHARATPAVARGSSPNCRAKFPGRLFPRHLRPLLFDFARSCDVVCGPRGDVTCRRAAWATTPRPIIRLPRPKLLISRRFAIGDPWGRSLASAA